MVVVVMMMTVMVVVSGLVLQVFFTPLLVQLLGVWFTRSGFVGIVVAVLLRINN